MPTVVGIRFKTSGKIYYFAPGKIELKPGDAVIVETAQGSEYGNVVISPREVSDDDIVPPLKKIVRPATYKDEQRLIENKERANDAVGICEEMIGKHKLSMKLVNVEYAFDRKKILFYFTSSGRVDFRNLVKDLASAFKTRIELRQIGVRDEAKLLGGLGSCGREVCCKSFLNDFKPVSIKMAKDQGISLNPTKISGLCGRLMCCLEYEHDFYKSVKPKMKKKGAPVMTPMGPGQVLDNLVLQEKCKVKVIMPGDNFEVKTFEFDEVEVISDKRMQVELDKVRMKKVAAPSYDNPYETWDKTEKTNSRQKPYPPKRRRGSSSNAKDGDNYKRNKKNNNQGINNKNKSEESMGRNSQKRNTQLRNAAHNNPNNHQKRYKSGSYNKKQKEQTNNKT